MVGGLRRPVCLSSSLPGVTGVNRRRTDPGMEVTSRSPRGPTAGPSAGRTNPGLVRRFADPGLMQKTKMGGRSLEGVAAAGPGRRGSILSDGPGLCHVHTSNLPADAEQPVLQNHIVGLRVRLARCEVIEIAAARLHAGIVARGKP